MHPVIQKSFGGLTSQYYFRNLIYAFVIAAFFCSIASLGDTPLSFRLWFVLTVNTFLYPYSRYVYEKIIIFLTGDGVIVTKTFIGISVMLFTVLLCWSFAVFIAPVGLVYLYILNSKTANQG